MAMPGRTYSAGNLYRYGFNGKENDNEVKGEGNQIAFEARIYDPRVGRFLSGDPLERTFPWQSTYVFAANNPIKLIDIHGMGAGDPTPVYHRTTSEAAASIYQNGFDPGLSKRYGFSYLSTDPTKGSFGRDVANKNTLVTGEIDLSNAGKITTQQQDAWSKEGLAAANKELKTNYKSFKEIPKEKLPIYQSIKDGYKNDLMAEFMNASGKDVFVVEGANTIAVAEHAISQVHITGLSGPGASEAVSIMSRPALSGEATAALKEYGRACNTIKWGGRACLAIAVASDIYEIYQSDNKMRTITKKVGGWAAGLSMGAWGAAAGSETGPGAIITGLIGFGVGYFVGEKTTEIVYDYLFKKGINAR